MADQAPVGLVLASHATLAQGLRAAAEMIAGPQEHLAVVPLGPAENLDEYRAKLEAAAREVDTGRGVLVLVDLFGGSPGNTAAYLVSDQVEVVGGASLPMLLEVLMARAAASPDELAVLAARAGREATIRFKEIL
ncbi:MAG TPA: PTS sugar transporter subunit IIA [Symbiobacteriaceae bacterium]|nr:PTS sugar transporter subunit IIA [Symbiobacteriaceae bacterium]